MDKSQENKRRVTFMLRPATIEKIKAKADKLDISMSSWVAMAIHREIREQEEAFGE